MSMGNKVNFKTVGHHTIVISPKYIAFEHLIHIKDHNSSHNSSLTPFACMGHNPKEIPTHKYCQCPHQANCPLLLATRCQILFKEIPTAQQVIIPFSRNEPNLIRRLPKLTKGMGDMSGRERMLRESAADLDLEMEKKRLAGAGTHEELKGEYKREHGLLTKLAAKEAAGQDVGGGVTVKGLRLAASETLRKLMAVGGSQAEEKESVPRVWCIVIERGFEKKVEPWQILRMNFDGFMVFLKEGVSEDMRIPAHWYPYGW